MAANDWPAFIVPMWMDHLQDKYIYKHTLASYKRWWNQWQWHSQRQRPFDFNVIRSSKDVVGGEILEANIRTKYTEMLMNIEVITHNNTHENDERCDDIDVLVAHRRFMSAMYFINSQDKSRCLLSGRQRRTVYIYICICPEDGDNRKY